MLIHFKSPGKLPVYAYGVRWLLAGTITTHDSVLFLPNLPNGEFIISISDLANPAVQSARLRVIVESPLWLRWWFLPLMFLFGLLFVSAALYLLYLYRLRQFLQMQRVRDRIARDLHDDMGSYLSSISIMSQTAHRNALRNPEKTQLALASIGQTARQVIDRMGDMVWSINPAHDSINDVLTRMADVGNSLFGTTDVVFNLSVAEAVRHVSLSAEVRREFFLIYKEAVTNVARYAQASNVRVAVEVTGSGLVLTVQDNGCGFDPAQPDYKNPGGGNGLRNMQARAKLIGGELTIQSTAGQGTTVRLIVGQGGA
ncbi:sensor histidine kinase [Fibrella aquatilis]|uniref:Sensor histidine kinase n=1 Tax=Fibrella aquatilis TaxID=2817059 RepID=A0A939JZ30_9BACT|nr:sensor histidine kinase [Fibrella aquatilis]MBO0929740.1 sensor histidine kinase [Fibrella aquatilis]